MRMIFATILIAAALSQAAIDWQATIGQGYAYRFGTIASLLQGHWPDGYARLVVGLKDSGIPWAWDPIGAILLSVPIAPALAAIGVGLIVTRQRARAR